MALKRHHKIVIGSFTTIVIIYMVVNAILLNGIIVKQTLNHQALSDNLNELEMNTNTKLNELTKVLGETQKSVLSINESVGTQINLLKASTAEDFSGIIEDAVKSVVTVRTNAGQGTGFIINEEGYFVTNAHVLAGATEAQAVTYEQEVIPATLIGYNEALDVALLNIPGEYEKIDLEDSDEVQVGEKVIAIGNPLGLQFSVSEGIVSGVHRPGPSGLNAYIQTDAALNPGNSGGPLINKKGKVIGINNFKIGGGESLGFALESNYIKEIVNDIFFKAKNETLIE